MTDTPDGLRDWTSDLAAALGVQEDVPITELLNVTRDVAHGVTRPAGPVTTYLIGRAVAQGLPLEQAIAVVQARIAEQP
ncbi:DUF6457 domain-containing protein [Microbacterium sp. M28]|uniref:DUF6457 domain-containing protein n=1 Tax=Microbacterium sp. M28 TaxID=2962064 RepID=UPI0021F42488|nr:DUF6457 domain-containing protein [Microbacterium sp. M28]UYO95883.1 DUF6457 domain-containing protein [Microbacterium sp. M28]